MTDFCIGCPPQPLLIKHLLDRSLAWAPEQRIVYRDVLEFTYTQFFDRVQRLASVLTRLGLGPGDRVGVADWDSHRYLECFFAVPMVGAVLHTINTRLSPEQTLFTLQHAEDKALFLHEDFIPLIEPLAARLPAVKTMVLMNDHGRRPACGLSLAGEYEELLARAEPRFAFADFDENTVATLFYTTGTTGAPKGVFFTHRQLVLHTLGVGLLLSAFREPVALEAGDVYMPLTPMFHVHGWGIPYIATLLGVKQVYPGRYEPATLLGLIHRHQVTFSHCVPTILQTLLHHPDSHSVDFSSWKVIIGGAALTPGLARQAVERGIRVMSGYGMSETCPVVAGAHIKPSLTTDDPERRLGVLTRAGFPAPLVRAAVLDLEGRPLPPGKQHTGELVLQAPWLTTGYFRNEETSRDLWRDGWLHTGDVAYLDEDGYIRITDRLKDVIKIGGEWISSLELENALSQHEAVKEVAVVGLPDAKWDERPRALVVLREEARGRVTAKDLGRFLHGFIDRGQIHKRAILTEITLVETLPRTSVGKLDKKALRTSLGSAAGSRHDQADGQRPGA
jgi:fatty-acyl-CoA synthase